jgi:hypothetical protein
MSAAAPEIRTPVMTLVEASWEDSPGVWQTGTARMEDRSTGGACIRVKTAIGVGSRVRIRWRFEQFSGTAKYCRGEGKGYLVGIQRDGMKSANPVIEAGAASQEKGPGGPGPVVTIKTQTLPERQESGTPEIPMHRRSVENAQAAAFDRTPPRSRIRFQTNATDTDGIPQAQQSGVLQAEVKDAEPKEVEPKQAELKRAESDELPTKRKETRKERKPMARKWLELAPWQSKQDGLNQSRGEEGTASSATSTDRSRDGTIDEENRMPHMNRASEKPSVHGAREVPNFRVELLPMEDIYRAAGTMNPRRGYSINKVVEMVRNEHIRGLSKEMKQAAVLMALDAAGISFDQVRQDAKARQEVLDSYEAAQKKQVEAMWARKAEEVVQIQAELESVKAHHLARISRNLEGVAREKATFNSWLTLKQQECENMAEAVELCMKAPAPESSGASLQETGKEKAAAAVAGGKLE